MLCPSHHFPFVFLRTRCSKMSLSSGNKPHNKGYHFRGFLMNLTVQWNRVDFFSLYKRYSWILEQQGRCLVSWALSRLPSPAMMLMDCSVWFQDLQPLTLESASLSRVLHDFLYYLPPAAAVQLVVAYVLTYCFNMLRLGTARNICVHSLSQPLQKAHVSCAHTGMIVWNAYGQAKAACFSWDCACPCHLQVRCAAVS